MLKEDCVDLSDLRDKVLTELLNRGAGFSKFRYSNIRGGKCDFYGTAAAVNIYFVLGIPLGSIRIRWMWAKVIKSFRKRDGSFATDSPELAMGIAIQVLNLLGAKVPKNIPSLAPSNIDCFKDWLEDEDWDGTHKRLWGGMIPLLASNLVSSSWIQYFVDYISSRLKLTESPGVWCSDDSPPWKIISSAYHILAIFDAAGLPYPHSDLLVARLLSLDWHLSRHHKEMTVCTDGDWAWLLVELCKLQPNYFERAIEQIKSVSKQRAQEWNSNSVILANLSTHYIYCYLWVTALFQHLDRESFKGPWLYDTLNSPYLFRL